MTAKTTRRTANTAPPAVPPITAVIGAACSDLVETPAKCISDFLKILFVLFLQFKKNIECFLVCTFNQHLSFIFFLRVSQALLHCSLQRIQGTNIKDCLMTGVPTFVAYVTVPASLRTRAVFRVTRAVSHTVSTLGQTLISVGVQWTG